ncbi:MAG: M15 family metallopeptidase [Aliiglaciecola sp.]
MNLTARHWLGLTDEHIQPIDDMHGLEKATKQAFLAMQDAAHADNIDLQLVSSFRDFKKQLSIWQRKWIGDLPLYSIENELINGAKLDDLAKIHAIMTWSAMPGGSRHHWGTDFDVFDRASCKRSEKPFQLISPEYQPGGPCYELNCWLNERAAEFGFIRPYAAYNGGVAPEAWHLSYEPVSSQIVNSLDIKALHQQIEKTEIGGKATLLRHLEALFKRYTLNGVAA